MSQAPSPSGGPTRRLVQSVERAAGLLVHLGRLGQPASLSELAAASGLKRATAWRLLTTLEEVGFVERTGRSGFSIGYGLVAIATSVLDEGEALAQVLRPRLERLARETGVSAALSVVRAGRPFVVEQADPPSVLAVSWVGKEFPLHTSSPGKLLLCDLPASELDILLAHPLERLTRKTITDPNRLRAELARVRRTGVAVSNEEFEEGCVGISAPVKDRFGRLAGILTLTGPIFRMPARRFPELRQMILAAAAGPPLPGNRAASADRQGAIGNSATSVGG
jgi:DNA-binding IclR family transcriptional regulator